GKAEGTGEMRDLLGGKGAGLAEMTNAGLPVPPGFTIQTEACTAYLRSRGQVPDELAQQQREAVGRLEELLSRKLGDPDNPLLVSVRSGAKFSMPGMMDTILNLGLNDRSVEGLAKQTDNPRFAYDSYRRFLQMFGNVVLGIDKDEFEHRFVALRKEKGVEDDLGLDTDDLKKAVSLFQDVIREKSGKGFPQDPVEQLDMARDAVFRSWKNERAIYYRRKNRIPDDLGTAVNVQAMVFGNRGANCATGVGFTRDPATGENEFYGEYLLNAQGEDVVAGIRDPKPIAELEKEMPEVYRQLREITGRLEKHYRDVQDFEFTVEEGTLYMLQTRRGQRTAQAAVKIAVDMVQEGLIRKEEALLRVEPAQLDQLLHPQIDPKAKVTVLAKGLAASPGAAVGKVVFDPDEAVEWVGRKEKVVLVRPETTPDDIHGMDVSQGILTATGGMTSHAAVVARGMGKCCVAGCSAARVHEAEGFLEIGGKRIERGGMISLNGSTGEVLEGEVPTLEPEVKAEFKTFMDWADEIRELKVRTNADTPRDANQARDFGAEGIGLCRTEHMFFAEERLPHVQRMILNAPAAKQLRLELMRLEEERKAASGAIASEIEEKIAAKRKELEGPQGQVDASLEKILPFQRDDFHGILKAMAGLPVTIRTLDPPLHEFLPSREELLVEIARMEERGEKGEKLEEKRRLLDQVEGLHEFNPMMGHRGCRLGITYPEITQMQARAILEAACALKKEGVDVYPEIMIPLVGHVREFVHQAAAVRETADAVMKEQGVEVPYLVGTMIEIPRAALTADQVASEAEFFSFGTNDLTQMAFGYSRDDAGKFLREYVELGILEIDPFVSVDQVGVGRLVETATKEGRKARRDLKVGICGEHGGDPDSIDFFYRTGLDYVSCSPFRVPIARLAAAQATLRAKSGATAERTA
ncbi:MAG: pyruvate, phosphate dikinase, partial [Candidatus Eisenbacteria bacterium]|nr:pyruvate, phosphate dikinase [Candidatus Latescibacterota bacterium]MBD3303153.1 pyruvate, phosphate dikinase [Candidatus Eisenbacteria bacterium]